MEYSVGDSVMILVGRELCRVFEITEIAVDEFWCPCTGFSTADRKVCGSYYTVSVISKELGALAQSYCESEVIAAE